MKPTKLTRAGLSLRIFGAYMLIAGTIFMIVPQILLHLLHLTAGDQTWVRMMGLLAIVIGYNHQVVVSKNLVDMIRNSSWLRYFGAVVMTSLVSLNFAGQVLLIMAAIDFLSATWTMVALTLDKQEAHVIQRPY